MLLVSGGDAVGEGVWKECRRCHVDWWERCSEAGAGVAYDALTS